MPRKLTDLLLIEIANLTPRQLSNSLPIANSTPRQLTDSLQAPITNSLLIDNSTPRQLTHSLQAPIANSLPINDSTPRELTHSLPTRVARPLIPQHAIDQFQRLDRERQVVQVLHKARHQEIATGVEFLLQQAQL
jgi:hypothetical protein